MIKLGPSFQGVTWWQAQDDYQIWEKSSVQLSSQQNLNIQSLGRKTKIYQPSTEKDTEGKMSLSCPLEGRRVTTNQPIDRVEVPPAKETAKERLLTLT